MDNRNDRTGRTDGVCVGMRVRGGCLPWMETREYSYLLVVLHDSMYNVVGTNEKAIESRPHRAASRPHRATLSTKMPVFACSAYECHRRIR